MRIRVTPQDIAGAGRDVLDNPLTRAVRRVTGQPWLVFICHKALEMTAPFRSVNLPPEAARACEHHHRTGAMQPFEFDLDIPTKA